MGRAVKMDWKKGERQALASAKELREFRNLVGRINRDLASIMEKWGYNPPLIGDANSHRMDAAYEHLKRARISFEQVYTSVQATMLSEVKK